MKKNKDSLMLELARYIEKHFDEKLTLKRLASEMLLSQAHLQKRFKEEIGVTPKEFQEACRLKEFKKSLRRNKTITEAIYEAGHSSPSRVYESLDERIGMTPKAYQKRGSGLDISYGTGVTKLGKILIAATDRGVCFLQFGNSIKELIIELNKEFPEARILRMRKENKKLLKSWLNSLNTFIDGNVDQLQLPMDVKGTAFQMKVWKFLQSIPKGEVISYTELAIKIGSPKSVRAVASACARNKIAIAIPCHRVLRGNGQLAGYRWGLERKEKLLQLEKNKADPSNEGSEKKDHKI